MTDPVDVLDLPDGRRLAYTEWGAPGGFPTFYFHGTPGSRLEGGFAHEAAVRHGFRLVALDRPGFGLSSFQEGRRFGDWPADVLALADGLGVEQFGVVGHSGGGPHLFACGSAIDPARLRFIGALGPWGPVATPEIMASLNPLDRFYARVSRRSRLLMRATFAPLGWCARYWPSLFATLVRSAVSPADRAALADGVLLDRFRASEREAFRQGGRGAAHEAALAYGDWDVDLDEVDVPTHVWLGDEDVFVSQEMGAHIERTIPRVDVHWIEGAGHLDVSLWDDILAACAADVGGGAPE